MFEPIHEFQSEWLAIMRCTRFGRMIPQVELQHLGCAFGWYAGSSFPIFYGLGNRPHGWSEGVNVNVNPTRSFCQFVPLGVDRKARETVPTMNVGQSFASPGDRSELVSALPSGGRPDSQLVI